MTSLPGPRGLAGHHDEIVVAAGIALTPLSGGQILLAIAVIAGVSVVLWIPVLWDRLTAFLSSNAPKWAPRMFVGGLALLLIGLAAGLHVLALIGGCTIGALAISLIYDNY